MTDAQERYARIKQLFLDACARTGGDRDAFVASIDDQLRDEVTALLREHVVVESGGSLDAGSLYANRYRIEARLGTGGMGEVYRASDTKLGVPVALKRIRPGATGEQVAREVRLARGIVHRSVCRVYDIGEYNGETFLTMEYIDGEDLAALLRRIRRLPSDKVTDIARQLCGALAAAHANGILHRDLKPANVMIDSRGDIRLTDFGIAVEEARADRRIVGTPAYMSPEQIAGAALNPRSDLYSLGALLYELLTGQPPFRAASIAELLAMQRESQPIRPSEVVTGVDPQLEQAILHALEKNPADRPPSALALAGELPGVDPLAVAAEAGITAPPESVASARAASGLTSRTAIGALIAVVVLLGGIVALSDRAGAIASMRIDPPQLLAGRAADVVRQFGLTVDARNARFGFLSDPRAAPARSLLFWWRRDVRRAESRLAEELLIPSEKADFREPQEARPKSSFLVVLEPDGSLVHFESPPETGSRSIDRPRDLGPPSPAENNGPRIAIAIVLLLAVFITFPLAIRNLTLGRSDRSGARNLAMIVAALVIVHTIFAGSRIAHPLHDSSVVLLERILLALFAIGYAWTAYVALEPYARRRWPRTLIAWTRLLHGAVRDPLVGREILIGVLLGTAITLSEKVYEIAAHTARLPIASRRIVAQISNAIDSRALIAAIAAQPASAIRDGVIMLMLLLVLRSITRHETIGATLFVILAASIVAAGTGQFLVAWPTIGLLNGIMALVLLRQGFLAFVASALIPRLLDAVPLTLHGEAWYADSGYAVVILIIVMAAVAARISRSTV